MNLPGVELTTASVLSDEEVRRMDQPSTELCQGCGGPLTVGEFENANCCTACYFKTLEDTNGNQINR